MKSFVQLFFFAEQDMDGNAVAMSLASVPGPDWLKDIIPTLGVRLKVHTALRTLYNDDLVSSLVLLLINSGC